MTAPESAYRAERIALAILAGGAEDVVGAFDALRLANRETAVARDAEAVTALRAGRAPWTVPQRAPWAGF